jgi:hypothetical protein
MKSVTGAVSKGNPYDAGIRAGLSDCSQGTGGTVRRFDRHVDNEHAPVTFIILDRNKKYGAKSSIDYLPVIERRITDRLIVGRVMKILVIANDNSGDAHVVLQALACACTGTSAFALRGAEHGQDLSFH